MKIDPATERITATIGVGDGPTGIVAAKDGVWVSNEFDATLDRIDVQIDAGSPHGSPGKLAAGPGGGRIGGLGRRAAVPVGQPPRRHLDRRDTTCLPRSTRPGGRGITVTVRLTAVYDGLTAFRRSGGAAGLTLVPDLARTLPRPTAGGTTYTFTLRRGIRYSNGASGAGVRLPARHPAPAQLRPRCRLLRRHPRGIRVTSSIRNGAICPPGSSPMTRRAGSPSAWSRRTPISSTSSRCRSPCPHHPARPATSSTGRRSCPAPAPT